MRGVSPEPDRAPPPRVPIGPGHVLLAGGMIALGLRGIAYGSFAGVWQRIPIAHLPARPFFIYATALVELLAGIGLLIRRSERVASAVLFTFLALWTLLLKLPAVVGMPSMEATWLGFGEIAVIAAGGWAIWASNAGAWARRHLRYLTGAHGVRLARLLFGVSMPMVGLSHFFYMPQTVGLVPAWLPYREGWAYLTGAGSIAAGLGVLFGVWPRLAATAEAVMLCVITVLVWLPGVVAAPGDASITPFLMSSVIAFGVWALADSYRGEGWLRARGDRKAP